MEQTEESAAEPEAERRRSLGLVEERRVVELKLGHARLELLVIGGVDRVDAGEHHRADLLESGQRRRTGGLDVGDGVAHLGVGGALEVGQQIAHAPGGQLVGGAHFGAEEADFLDFALDAVVEEANPAAATERAVLDPDVVDHAAVGVVVGVENQRGAARHVERLRRRDAFDHRFEQLGNPHPRFAGDAERLLAGQRQNLLHLLVAELEVGRRKVDLVDDRNHLEVLFERQVHVGHRLRLNALRGVDEEQRALAGAERPGNLIGEVHVPRSVDQIQLVGIAVLRRVVHADRVRLDGDAALAFQVHPVQQLFLKVALGHRAGQLEQPVGEGGLAVIDVCDNAEIPYQFQFCHGIPD